MRDVENDARFRTFGPAVKIRGGGEISIPIGEALIQPDHRISLHLMAIHCAAAERNEFVRKRKRKESLWVKLKVKNVSHNILLFKTRGNCNRQQTNLSRNITTYVRCIKQESH